MEENEVCPVFVARSEQQPTPHPEEADDWSWVRPEDLRVAVMSTPFAFSPWLVSQVRAGVLDKLPGQQGSDAPITGRDRVRIVAGIDGRR